MFSGINNMKQNTYIEDTICLMNSLNTAYRLQDCHTLCKWGCKCCTEAYRTRIRVYCKTSNRSRVSNINKLGV